MNKQNLFRKLLNVGQLMSPFLWPIALVAVILLALVWLTKGIEQTSLDVVVDDRIDRTTQYVEQIKTIGEWEFLTIEDEELVDTVRKGFFSDDHLVRIYYGTLRIGTNLQAVREWDIRVSGDTISVILPQVGLLDERFIDEARTKSFHESGDWTPADREALYQKAHRQMLHRRLTPEVVSEARRHGEQQVAQLLRAWGFKHVEVSFSAE
jgi:hypothetical protein